MPGQVLAVARGLGEGGLGYWAEGEVGYPGVSTCTYFSLHPGSLAWCVQFSGAIGFGCVFCDWQSLHGLFKANWRLSPLIREKDNSDKWEVV